MDLFKPRGSLTIRPPISDEQKHGQIINPPRFAHMGGLKSASKAGFKNSMTIGKPGDTKKVI